MYIKIKTMDGKQSVILTVSKMSQIEDVRVLIQEKLEIEPACQRLFFRGKQMEDGYRLIDYGINVNDVVQLMIRAAPPPEVPKEEAAPEEAAEDKKSKKKKTEEEEVKDVTCEYYEVNDLVDAKDPFTSSWVEAKIVKIAQPIKDENPKTEYHVLYQGHERESPTPRSFEQIRPRAETIIHVEDLEVGQKAMVNYNMEDPKERGLWYDAKVTKLAIKSRTNKRLIVTLIMGEESDTEVNDCKIHFVKEVFQIPTVNKRVDQTPEDTRLLKKGPATKRESAPYCVHCRDNPEKKCKICGCHECGSKENPDKQLMCDECDLPYHIYCLKPPLEEMPDVEEWYCPKCKNDGNDIVKAGEKLKESKKKAKAPSNVNKNTGRDWGRGMACAGRGKECTIVPSNHFGPIPGVDVGTTWRFRFQASEAGVHRPPVGGIHGREKEGAYSIVLSGGYEDDVDNGDSFYYTGSGGRDLTGNKRTAEQSCDQTLTRMNLALALNCNAPVNTVEGAEAKDWRKGKPVRVLRKGHGDEKTLAKGKTPKSSKSKHNTNFGPEIGVRYDGIYKIVKYWPEKGKSGHLVWRYILRRDDPVPPVWTPEGKKRVQELGLDQVIYPEGHLEAQEAKAQELEKNGGGSKRKTITELLQAGADNKSAKKAKKAGYQLENEVDELIKADHLNVKLWEDCREALGDTKQKFVTKVEERFLCICCQDVVCRPVTTPCTHNLCLTCLQRSFKAEVYNCPSCRHELGKNMDMEVNEELSKALNAIFPGYENGR